MSVDIGLTASINTDGISCTRVKAQASPLPAICIVVKRNILFDTGSTVTVTGSRALALVATGTMTLKGTIDASANGPTGGPGAMASGAGVGSSAVARPMDMGDTTPGNAGGGGGGFGMSGAPGGDDSMMGMCMGMGPCATPGAGGFVQGLPAIIPLRSGSIGGTNSAPAGNARQGAPGGGGGVLQLVGCSAMTIASTALFDANGGGGQGGRPGSGTTPGAGAGGGSGGGILIEAQTMSLATGIQLYANGGGGGGGATLSTSGGDGDDGPRARSAAGGGDAATGGSGTSFAGGSGGYANNAGTPVGASSGGGPAGDTMSAAGGGGGGVGRVRLNYKSASPAITDVFLLASPVQTVGTIAACASTSSPTGPCLR
jgi:hypothetical protein